MRDGVITIILIVIMVLNGMDVFVDIGLKVPVWHIVQESTLVVLSAIGVTLLILHMRKKTASFRNLSGELKDAKHQISNLNSKINEERKHFGEVIKQQFEEWKLTDGEQQVALLLLKGLSLKEVSVVRNTRESTVRQQASSIYAKSNLEGRHEFAAWFLEDFLDVV